MAVIEISQKALCALSSLQKGEVEHYLTELGIPIDGVQGDIMHLEITPNRPDWLSVEGVARSCRSYKEGKPVAYSASKSQINFIVDPAIKKIRPFICSAYLKGANLGGGNLKSLIQLQEKLHDTLGRQRRKMAIGLHDASAVAPPFKYWAAEPSEIKFTPLGMDVEMACAQILKKHEKGIKYAHLVGSKCPVITDKNNNVLSFPPIINGELTKVGENTKDLLVDCTGTHEKTVQVATSILCAALVDMGAKAYTVSINSKPCQIFQGTQTKISIEDANRLLGTSLGKKEIAAHLARMGHELKGGIVYSPAFRADILHPVDLFEDIAISIGYNNFEPKLADFSSISKYEGNSYLHEAALGLGYFEVSSWILTSKSVLEKSMVGLSGAIKPKNPLTDEFTTLRPALYPNLLQIFANSKSEPMPQFLYEIGPAIKKEDGKISQCEKICLAAAHSKSGFSQILSHMNSFLSSLKISHLLEETSEAGFIAGRCANVKISGETAGIIGEIHPQVLESFSIEQPVALFELDLKFLK